jgi:hypothetical protein
MILTNILIGTLVLLLLRISNRIGRIEAAVGEQSEYLKEDDKDPF